MEYVQPIDEGVRFVPPGDTWCYNIRVAQTDDRRARVAVNVSLTQELARFVQAKVEAGTYASASEVVRDGLRLLLEQERLREARLHELRDQVRIGLDQARRGELVDAETAFSAIERDLDDHERERGRT